MRLTTNNRHHLLAVALILAAGSSTLPAFDLGVRVGQDGLFAQGRDSAVTPAALLAEVDFGLGPVALVRAQAGYCYYRNMDFIINTNANQRTSVDGARAGVVPLVSLPTPLDWLALRGGVGVALGYSRWENVEAHYYSNDTRYERTARYTLTGTQSFVGEARCELSPRLAFLVGLERTGFRAVASDSTYSVSVGESQWTVRSHDGWFFAGWDRYAQNTISAALHFKL